MLVVVLSHSLSSPSARSLLPIWSGDKCTNLPVEMAKLSAELPTRTEEKTRSAVGKRRRKDRVRQTINCTSAATNINCRHWTLRRQMRAFNESTIQHRQLTHTRPTQHWPSTITPVLAAYSLNAFYPFLTTKYITLPKWRNESITDNCCTSTPHHCHCDHPLFSIFYFSHITFAKRMFYR